MMRRRFLLVAAVGALLAGTAALAGCGGRSESQGCDIPRSAPEKPASVTAAPGGGKIRVVEQGFTQLPEPNEGISIGAVVQNTSDRIAYRTKIVFRLLDSEHKEVTEPDPSSMTAEIPVIMPGQRIGTGINVTTSQAVSSVMVRGDTTTWMHRGALGDDFSPDTASYLRTMRYAPRNPGAVDIHYRERSTNCRKLGEGHAAVVFRDAQRKIVGGAVTTPDAIPTYVGSGVQPPERRLPSSMSCTPGSRETWILTLQPPGADDRQTRLYPYCDLKYG